MQYSCVLHSTKQDEGGQPVAGLQVFATAFPQERSFEKEMILSASIITGQNGRFVPVIQFPPFAKKLQASDSRPRLILAPRRGATVGRKGKLR